MVDESARNGRYFIAAAIVDPAQVSQIRRTLPRLLLPGQRELHFYREKPVRRRLLADAIARLPVEAHIYSGTLSRHDEPVRQRCMARLVADLLDRRAHRLVIDNRSNKDVHDERTFRRLLGPHPSASELVYEHLDSVSEPLLWIADLVAWCHGAGREWRKRVDPITSPSSTWTNPRQREARECNRPETSRAHFLGLRGLGTAKTSTSPTTPPLTSAQADTIE